MILMFVIIWILCGILGMFFCLYDQYSHYSGINFILDEWIEPESIALTFAGCLIGPIFLIIFTPKAIKIFIENLIERKHKNDK